MIRRLLIANRGEIALRIIRACRELGIESVAVYSAADAHAPHVAAADRAVRDRAGARARELPHHRRSCSTPRARRAPTRSTRATGSCPKTPRSPRLRRRRAGLRRSAGRRHRADGIEDRRATRWCRRPACRSCPARRPTISPTWAFAQAIERVGLPVLIKASAGGGGKGMRHVHDAGEIDESIQAARREATAAFGDGTLYVERLVAHPRHVEVQIFADDHGGVLHLFERDCSTQRRHQKVIEESPSPAADAGAARADDRGRGRRGRAPPATATPARSNSSSDGDAPFYFLEMNTRLQVEHPVTEQVTGLDLVRAQILVANGEPLPWTQAEISQRGHAIEARVYAEDPAQGFIPQAGTLTALSRAATTRHSRRRGRRRRRRGLGLLRPDDRQGDRDRRDPRPRDRAPVGRAARVRDCRHQDQSRLPDRDPRVRGVS